MTPAEAEALVPLAAELIATLRDYSVDDVAAVLDRVPDHRALAVVLAAMVDPDARPSELLAWTTEPVQSRDFTPSHFRTNLKEHAGKSQARRDEIARMTANGMGPTAIAREMGLDKRTVVRHRTAIRGERVAS